MPHAQHRPPLSAGQRLRPRSPLHQFKVVPRHSNRLIFSLSCRLTLLRAHRYIILSYEVFLFSNLRLRSTQLLTSPFDLISNFLILLYTDEGCEHLAPRYAAN
jgi:hypothetical protein